jgi:hypothetical protein
MLSLLGGINQNSTLLYFFFLVSNLVVLCLQIEYVGGGLQYVGGGLSFSVNIMNACLF